MTPDKSKEEKPCIDLKVAQELLATGKLGLKQLEIAVNRQRNKGVDVADLVKILNRGKATERSAKHLLETAFTKYEIGEKEV